MDSGPVVEVHPYGFSLLEVQLGDYEFCLFYCNVDGGFFDLRILEIGRRMRSRHYLLSVRRDFVRDRMSWGMDALWGLVKIG